MSEMMPLSTIEYTLYFTHSTQHSVFKVVCFNLVTLVILCKVGEVHIFKHRLYISVLEQARVLILGKYALLGVINTISRLSDFVKCR